MVARRGLLAGGAALATLAPEGSGAVAQPAELRFDVLRNGTRIGQHGIAFRQDATVLTASVSVEIVVRLGPIPVFRYTHTVREIWRDGLFHSLDSETNEDGKRFRVTAARAAEGIVVASLAVPRTVLPSTAIPLTHWNALCMERPLFNPQDGVPITARVVAHGEDQVALADGRLVRATRYALIGTPALEDWYDTARLWTALRSRGTDGSTIEYRRVA